MNEQELRKYAKCSSCGKGVCSTGLPLFLNFTIERIGINQLAIQRHAGLEMMTTPALASVMGTGEEVTETMTKEIVTLCEGCVYEKAGSLIAMLENRRREIEEGEDHGKE